MMKINKLALLALLGVLLLNSCSNDDDALEPLPEGDYTDGFFVLNEGSFGSGGSVSFISDDFTTTTNEVYKVVNPEAEDLGLFTQSIFFDDTRAFIISNGSNKITVLDRYTFDYIEVIDSGLAVPRYGEIIDGKAYVTNQNDFGTGEDDYVAIIDLDTYSVDDTVLIGNKIDKLIEEDGLLYIQGSAFGEGNSINVFDPVNQSVVETYNTAPGLNSFDIEEDVIYAFTSAGLQTIALGSGTVNTQIEFSEDFKDASYLTIENNIIYFIVGTSVYQSILSASEEPDTPLLSYSGSYAYGFAVEDDRIYIADGGDFSSDSFVEIYNTSGTLLENITVGIAPNGFYFN